MITGVMAAGVLLIPAGLALIGGRSGGVAEGTKAGLFAYVRIVGSYSGRRHLEGGRNA